MRQERSHLQGEFGEMKADAERPEAKRPDENAMRCCAILPRAARSLPPSWADPGPSRASLDAMLTIAARVPDHKKLAPWRFIVIEGDAGARFGAELARVCASKEPEASESRHATERDRFLRAPAIVAVMSNPVTHPAAPEWEQMLSAGAVCLNLLHAASAQGFGAQWITEWYGYDAQVRAAFGLAAHERIAGFVYIGTPTEKPPSASGPISRRSPASRARRSVDRGLARRDAAPGRPRLCYAHQDNHGDHRCRYRQAAGPRSAGRYSR